MSSIIIYLLIAKVLVDDGESRALCVVVAAFEGQTAKRKAWTKLARPAAKNYYYYWVVGTLSLSDSYWTNRA